jgi:hypothetical protein
MSERRKKIPLRPDEDRLLRKLYIQWRIPRGQYKSHPVELAAFVQLFNNLSGLSYSALEVLHYIETQQKAGERLKPAWPTFDGNHKKLAPMDKTLSDEEMAALREIWHEHVLPMNIGTDKATFIDSLVTLLEREFAKRTRHMIPGIMLLAIVENERKKGLWLTLRDDTQGGKKDDGIGFDDMDEAAGL